MLLNIYIQLADVNCVHCEGFATLQILISSESTDYVKISLIANLFILFRSEIARLGYLQYNTMSGCGLCVFCHSAYSYFFG